MKQKNKLARALIVSMLLFGIVFSLAACESMYGDIIREIEEQNPQLKLPEFTGDLSDLKEKLPKETIEGKPTDFISTDIPPVPPVELDPCEINGHVIVVDPEVEPTCTTSGKTEGSHCGRCGEVLVKQKKLSATGHTLSGWVMSGSKEGLKFRYCLICDTMLEELPYNTVEIISAFDNDGDGIGDVYTFSNYLPERFLLSSSTILLNGAAHLDTDLGVTKSERIFGSGIWHYYINLDQKDISNEMKSLTWEFEVLEAGTYDICFDLAMKDATEQRGTVMQIDDGQQLYMEYTITADLAETVRDETQGSYMTGVAVELTAGQHILRMTYNPLCRKTFHFRNIYLVKVS